ncbi:MAG TPA: hypothetical protein VF800_20850 [Telluria sp.]|jgi:hypothetical protein
MAANSPTRKKSQLAGELSRFVQQYARKAPKGSEPNDRRYDRKLEDKMKRLSPLDLSELLSGEEFGPVDPYQKQTIKDDTAG